VQELTVPHFTSNGVDIAYTLLGPETGEPILLIHGFASSVAVNWASTSWLDTLVADGRRVIAPDVRGHGSSAKLYDPRDYTLAVMAADMVNLLDHLAVSRADVMGYSMGARIAAVLTLSHPEKVRALVIGGMGAKLTGGLTGTEEIAAALEAPAGQSSPDPVAQGYRTFAERTRSDRRALAACMRGQREPIPPARLASVGVPVLIAVGTKDERVGSPRDLAALIPDSRVVDIVGRDHMLATGDRQFKAAVLEFLRERP
jgi:pimeloyl-ACP methyl ester carboxylesterase